jgi:translocation and assembly module TamB
MTRAKRWLIWVLAGIPLGVLVLAVCVLIAANTPLGRRALAQGVAWASNGAVSITGLEGRVPDRLRVRRVVLKDAHGVWLTADDVCVAWSPLRLFSRRLEAEDLAVGTLALERLPADSGSATSSGESFLHAISVGRVDVERLELSAALAGAPVALSVNGRVQELAGGRGALAVVAERLGAAGHYAISGRLDAAEIAGSAEIEEPEGGPLANLLHLPGLGALSVNASLAGPRSAAVVELAGTLGALNAALNGTVNLAAASADVKFALDSAAMAPRSDLGWKSLKVSGAARGTLATATANAQLELASLSFSDYAAGTVRAKLSGQRGALALEATASELTVPGVAAHDLAGRPLELRADLRLDQPGHPLNFSLAHALLTAQGTVTTESPLSGNAAISLRSLAPFARAAGVSADGRAALDVALASRGNAHQLTAAGSVSIDSGVETLRQLLGPDARLRAALTIDGSNFTVERAEVAGRALTAAASGTIRAGRLDLQFTTELADLAALAPELRGQLKASGRLAGPTDAFAIDAQASGELAIRSTASGPIAVTVHSTGWPAQANATIEVRGDVDAAPLSLAAQLSRSPERGLHATITRGEWRSARIGGEVAVPAGAHWPSGELRVKIAALQDLDRLLDQPLSGSAEAAITLAGAHARADARLTVRDGAVGALRVATLSLTGHSDHLDRAPTVTAEITGEGLELPHASGQAHLTAKGPMHALALRLESKLNVMESPLTLQADGSVDAPARRLLLSTLVARYREQTARLVHPAHLSFAEPVTVDALELSVESATLELSGQVSPTLALTGALKNVTPALLAPYDGGIAAEGTADLEFSIAGTVAAPTGRIRGSITGLRVTNGTGRGLPALSATLRAILDGQSARVDAQANAGAALDASVRGQMALPADGPIALTLAAKADLALLNPMLEANGRRLTGRLTAQGTLAGSRLKPEVTGAMSIEHGELHDYVNGIHLTDVAIEVTGDGDKLRIVRCTARAGSGSLALAGTVDIQEPGWPAQLTATARDARVLASDLVSANAEGEVRLTGPLRGLFTVAGRVHVLRADITLPNRLPPTVVVLDVRRPGQTAESTPERPPRDFAMDLTVEAESAIFVRGRGVDAELGGRLRITGTRRNPQVEGGFDLRRGTFSVGGAQLRFTSGRVTFTGQGLEKRLDPSLDLVASRVASDGSTATITIGGFVDAPTLTLSSTPEQPPDTILSLLLFDQPNVQQLSALQIAQVGAALASMSGVGGNGLDPLGSVQHTLGLDRLSLSSYTTGTTTGTTIEAGRYVSSRVYVGARQNTTGVTQAVVQIDLTRHLKLETAIGNGSNSAQGATPDNDPGNNIGISYQIEY